MPLWLTPRVRLGVTAAVIVLILSVFLLTPGGTTDAVTPTGQTSSTAVNHSVADDYPSHYKPYIPTLPVIDWAPATNSIGSAIVLDRGLGGTNAQEKHPNSEPETDWIAENLLAAQSIPLSTVCLDCGPPGLLAGLVLPLAGAPGGALGGTGGVGGGGGGGGVYLTALAGNRQNRRAAGDGPGGDKPDSDTRTNGANRTTGWSEPDYPGQDAPGPNQPRVAQVPEPSSIVVVVACALGFTIRHRLAANRRG
jgi:hypothetical protein